MSILEIIKSILSVFRGTTFSKLKDNGFWVAQHFYWQSLLHYAIYCFRFKSITFFSASNPAIRLGGMLDDTKTDVYHLLNPAIVPKTIIFKKGDSAVDLISKAGLQFPIICKPNIGYKGYNVVKIENVASLNLYLLKVNPEIEFLIQEFVDYEKEYSLLYYHYPKSDKTGIFSLIEKVYPFIIGTGKSTFRELIDQHKNAYLKKDWILEKSKERWDYIPYLGEKIIIDHIGNYSRGAKFYSLMDHVDQQLLGISDQYFKNINGMYFFRADLKSESLEMVRQGHFKILEINGAKSEPLHIYDPAIGFFKRCKIIKCHWKILADIVQEVKDKQGFIFPNKMEGLAALASIKEKVG